MTTPKSPNILIALKRIFQLSLLVIATSSAATTQPVTPTESAVSWQEKLDHQDFSFNEAEANAAYSLYRCRGNFRIDMLYDNAATWPKLIIKFERDGKEIISIDGNPQSVFGTMENVLYFAHFSPISDGCTVSATDLTTGKILWKKELEGLGLVSHSIYRNRVSIELMPGRESHPKGFVQISGHESFGDYVEVLDAETGVQLAHRVYPRR